MSPISTNFLAPLSPQRLGQYFVEPSRWVMSSVFLYLVLRFLFSVFSLCSDLDTCPGTTGFKSMCDCLVYLCATAYNKIGKCFAVSVPNFMCRHHHQQDQVALGKAECSTWDYRYSPPTTAISLKLHCVSPRVGPQYS